MAKLTFGPIVSNARKKIGGVVFTQVRTGSMIRKKVAPVQPRTDAQRGIRAGLTTYSKSWSSALNDAQRAAWTALAKTLTRSDKLGNKHTVGGIQLWVMLNQNASLIGLTLALDPPGSLDADSLTAFTINNSGLYPLTITGVVQTAGTNLYSYSGTPPYTPVVGDVVSVAGFANAGNNGIQNVSAVGAGTFSSPAPNGVNETIAATGTVLVFYINFTPNPSSANADMVIAASKPQSAGRTTSLGQPAFLGNLGESNTGPISIANPYVMKYGMPPPGRKVLVTAWNIDAVTGAASPKWSATASF